MQDLLTERRRVLIASDVKVNQRIRDHLPEYAVKNVYSQIREHPAIVYYLPTEEMDLGRWPDRRWFWGVIASLIPTWVDTYVAKCIVERNKIDLVKRTQKKTIVISDRWRAKL